MKAIILAVVVAMLAGCGGSISSVEVCNALVECGEEYEECEMMADEISQQCKEDVLGSDCYWMPFVFEHCYLHGN